MSNNLKFYQDKSLETPNIFHGFFTRLGGVSNSPYAGLNCGTGSNDNADKVQENRGLVACEAGVRSDNLLSLYQEHGAKVLYVGKPWASDSDDRPKADGFVTDKPDIALGILTADCAPVLLSGAKEDGTPVIGAAHAGWQGALKGVLENTVQIMVDIGTSIKTINACVGPCISSASYEVKYSFADRFVKENQRSETFFIPAANVGHLMFDLSGYCAWRLYRTNVKNITLLGIDTYHNEKEFYSFRRSTHRSESDYGRQISVISINN